MKRICISIVLVVSVLVLSSCKGSIDVYSTFEMNSDLIDAMGECELPTVEEQGDNNWVIMCYPNVYIYDLKNETYTTITIPIGETNPNVLIIDNHIVYRKNQTIYQLDFEGNELHTLSFDGDIDMYQWNSYLVVKEYTNVSDITVYLVDELLDIKQQLEKADLEIDFSTQPYQFSAISETGVYVLNSNQFTKIHMFSSFNDIRVEYVGSNLFILEESTYDMDPMSIYVYDGSDVMLFYSDLTYLIGYLCYPSDNYFCISEQDLNQRRQLVYDHEGVLVTSLIQNDFEDVLDFITMDVYYVFDYSRSRYTLYNVDGTTIDSFFIDDPDNGFFDFNYINGTILLRKYDYENYEAVWYRVDGDDLLEINEDVDWYGDSDVIYTLKGSNVIEHITTDGNVEVLQDTAYFDFDEEEYSKFLRDSKIYIVEDMHITIYDLSGNYIDDYEALARFKPFDYDSEFDYILVLYDATNSVVVKKMF